MRPQLYLNVFTPKNKSFPADEKAMADGEAQALCEALSPWCDWIEWIDMPSHPAFVIQVRMHEEETFLAEAAGLTGCLLTKWKCGIWEKVHSLQELHEQYKAGCERAYMLFDASKPADASAKLAYLQKMVIRNQNAWSSAEITHLRQLVDMCETSLSLHLFSAARDSAEELCDALFDAGPANLRDANEICAHFASMLQHKLNESGLAPANGKDVFSGVMSGMDGRSDRAREQIREAIRLLASVPHSQENRPELIASQIKQFVEVYLSANISVSQLASLFNYSEAHLNRIFRKAEGISVHTYISRKRLDAAKELLVTTDMRIGAIGTLCGFETSSYFVRFFKRTAGMTPQEYRLRKREKQAHDP